MYWIAMSPLLLPLHLVLVMFGAWVNRHQLEVIRFTDAERRRLARKAQALGRKVLNELETLVTPDTLLRWYREELLSSLSRLNRPRLRFWTLRGRCANLFTQPAVILACVRRFT
jgi:hypothetical protein